MSVKFDDTIKLLVEEGRKKGYLSYAEMNRLLEDQFVPPEQLDQVFVALEEAGVDMVDEADSEADASEATPVEKGKSPAETIDAKAAAALARQVALPEKIDDPVRMYLTQMGEIPLLTRPEEIYLAKTIEITRKRFRKKTIGSGFCMDASIDTLLQVARGELAFDRTLKVNPNPKPDDDPLIVETLGKPFLAKRLPVNIETIKSLIARIREEYRPLLDERAEPAAQAGDPDRGVPPPGQEGPPVPRATRGPLPRDALDRA